LQQAAAKVEDAVEKEKSDLWKQEMNKEIGYVDPSKAPPEEEAPLMGATGVPEDATGATGPAPPIEPAPPEKPDPGPAESLSDGDKLWIRREIEAAMQGMSPQSRAELNT